MNTPWGKSDSVTHYGPGISFYGTPSHGGFHVSAALNRTMPDALRNDEGWYEEDCECCKVALAFPDRFPKDQATARDTFRNWFPTEYERHYGVTLQPGESYIRDEELFKKAHAVDWVVISAFGDWQTGVPAGMVGVVATLGGTREPGSVVKARYFLVDAEEYRFGQGQRQHGFVINLDVHQETEDFTKFHAKHNAA